MGEISNAGLSQDGFDLSQFYAVFFEDPLGNRLEVCHHRMDR